MVVSSNASPLHGTEQDTNSNEANQGTVHKNSRHLHQVQKAKKRKNKEHRKRKEKRKEHFLRDLKRENAEMEQEVDEMKSKAAEMKHMMTELSNAKNQVANYQENLVENLLQKPLVQQLLGANQLEVLLLGNGLNQCSDGTGELKDRFTMLKMQIDILGRLFLN